MELTTALATGLYSSCIPVKLAAALPAPLRPGRWTGSGLLGTAEGLALAPFLPEGTLPLALFLAAASLAACWVCGRAERALGADDPRIILDEVVGYWAAVAFLPRTPRVLLACFVLFRALDAAKPPPVRWLERLPGGWGVVADDLGAGLAANLLVRLAMPCWPWLRA